MKDAIGSKRSRPNSDLDENDTKRGSSPKEKADKQKRKKLRKRRGSSSPEEDIIDGFVIASYASLRCLEVTQVSAFKLVFLGFYKRLQHIKIVM